MVIGAGAALLAFAVATFIPRRRLATPQPPTDGPTKPAEVGAKA